MTRIIAGSACGRQIRVPQRGTRPTTERVREALFSTLEHRAGLRGARVLDLFAGSGALGLEAASRGAAQVTLVEHNRKAAALCRANAAATGLHVDVRADTVERFLRPNVSRKDVQRVGYDIILADPPYDYTDEALTDLGSLLCEGGWLAREATVVIERSGRSPAPIMPPELAATGERKYGETLLWYYRETRND